MTSVHLTIKLVTAESFTVTVHDYDHATTLTLKHVLAAKDAVRFPVAAQRLIFQGQILSDDKLLQDANVTDGCALHLLVNKNAVPAVAAPAPVPAPAVDMLAPLRQALAQLTDMPALQTLQKICDNVVQNPTQDKFRKLRVGNAALKTKLLDRPGALACLAALGFCPSEHEPGFLVLAPTAANWDALVAGKQLVDSAVASHGASSHSSHGSGVPMGMGMGNGADMAAQAQAMLSNPAALAMLRAHPMVQQMMQSNPQLAQALDNPMLLQQALSAMQHNPQMMQHMHQVVQDPTAQARLQQQFATASGTYVPSSNMNSTAYSPFASSTLPGAVAPASTMTSTSSPSNDAMRNTTENDEEAFEEQAIAEAIARSLQEM